jgi:hypothetical protein
VPTTPLPPITANIRKAFRTRRDLLEEIAVTGYSVSIFR